MPESMLKVKALECDYNKLLIITDMEDKMSSEDYVPGTNIPKPACRLVGEGGNAFAIMGRVRETLRRSGVPKSVLDTYREKSMSGDYDNLLRVAMEYVEVK